jgi:hypothetical protein
MLDTAICAASQTLIRYIHRRFETDPNLASFFSAMGCQSDAYHTEHSRRG